VGGEFGVGSRKLLNLDGLSSLTHVGSDFTMGSNDLVENVDGLAALTQVGGQLLISANPALRDLGGLHNLESVGNGFTVILNEALPMCEAEELRDAIGLENIAGEISIADNNGGEVCAP